MDREQEALGGGVVGKEVVVGGGGDLMDVCLPVVWPFAPLLSWRLLL